MTDTEAKQAFINVLKNYFDESTIFTDKTTDIIVKADTDPSNWLYFELKTTEQETLDKNGTYFGAASLNQLKVAFQHLNKYYFVLAIKKSNKEYMFGLAKPKDFITYLTGLYMHEDFNIPKESIESVCRNNDNLREQLSKLKKKDFNIENTLPETEPTPSRKERISELKNFICQINKE